MAQDKAVPLDANLLLSPRHVGNLKTALKNKDIVFFWGIMSKMSSKAVWHFFHLKTTSFSSVLLAPQDLGLQLEIPAVPYVS